MNEQSLCLVRAIRGPVILITVGVLFAFDKFTEFHFGQTWPVLLIVVGLLSLAGGSRRYRGGRADPGQTLPQTPPPGGPEARP